MGLFTIIRRSLPENFRQTIASPENNSGVIKMSAGRSGSRMVRGPSYEGRIRGALCSSCGGSVWKVA